MKLAPPTYVDPRIRRKNMIFFIIQIWICLIPLSYLFYWFYYDYLIELLPFTLEPIRSSFRIFIEQYWVLPIYIIFIITPPILIFIYVITVVWTAIVTKTVIFYFKLRHKPIEGVFYRDIKDKDYYYWNKRNLSRIFLFWLLHSMPFTFLKITFTFRFLGVKIGKNPNLNHCWISPEFVEIGKNAIIGPSSALYSFQFQDDKLLVARVIIGDDVIIGSQSTILPGTHISNKVVVDSGSFSHPFSKLEENCLYKGCPIKKIENSPD